MSLQNQHDNSNIEVLTVGRPGVDITNPDTLVNAIQNYRPDIVVNAAAYTAVDKAEKELELAFAVNSEGAANVARLTSEYKVPLIHLSTDYVFSGDKTEAYFEHDAADPQSVYGASKLAGEKLVADLNPCHVILRTAWVYSPYGHNFVKTMLSLAESRDELSIVADQFGNPTDASAIASAVISVGLQFERNPEFDDYGIYHFCGPTRLNWAEFAREVFAASEIFGGPSARVADITTADYPTLAKRPSNSSLNYSKFAAEFSYDQPSMKASLNSTIKKITKTTDEGA